jgi:hypothetical protein
MTTPDDFEQPLARTPRRAAPPEWRAVILANANAAAAGTLARNSVSGMKAAPTVRLE